MSLRQKAAKELAKINKAKVRLAGILAISAKENEMAWEDVETNLAADYPPAIKKVSRISNLKAAAAKTVALDLGTANG